MLRKILKAFYMGTFVFAVRKFDPEWKENPGGCCNISCFATLRLKFRREFEYVTFSFPPPVFPDSSAVLGRSWMVEPEDSESSREEADKLEGLCRECGFRAEKR